MNGIRHAVYEDFRFVMVDDSSHGLYQRGTGFVPTHVSELWELAQAFQVSHIWVMPGSIADSMGYEFFLPRDGYTIFIPLAEGEKRPEQPRAARCWKDGASGTHAVYINFPARAPWAWDVKGHLDVLATLEYLTKTLPGEASWWSPPSAGEYYLKQLFHQTNRLQSYVADCKIDLSAMPFKRCQKDLFFKAPSMGPEMVGMWLHVIDKNAAHPAAASYMKTGVGAPEHLTAADISYPVVRPGAYRVKWDIGLSIYDGVRLPKIIEDGGEWVTLSCLRYAKKQGYHVEIQEAYVFGAQHVLFDEWVKDLWASRKLLQDVGNYPHPVGRSNAEASVKKIMNFTISSLRTNWWADMLECARVAQLANIDKLAAAGHFPAYCYHDEMGYASWEAMPDKALPDILKRQDGLGGYKHVHSVLIDQHFIDLWDKARPATINKWVSNHKQQQQQQQQKGLVVHAG